MLAFGAETKYNMLNKRRMSDGKRGSGMKKMTAQEAALKWNVSLRRVQDYCKRGKVPGAERFGANWMLPADAAKPADGRRNKGQSDADSGKCAVVYKRSEGDYGLILPSE